MTENDILKDLQKYKEILEAKVDLNVSANAETALSKVTKAIEEIQAYRAIGTVEELQRQKDYIDTISEVCSGYSELGTIEEFKALKDKVKCEDCAGCTAWKCDCANVRAKAIDDFEKEIVAEYDNDGCPNVTDYLDYTISIRDLMKIAEQLKGGAK